MISSRVTFLVSVCLLFLGCSKGRPDAGGAGAATSGAVGATAAKLPADGGDRLSGFRPPPQDVVVSMDGNTSYVLWDAYPSRDRIGPLLGTPGAFDGVAAVLADGGAKKFPHAPGIKVAIVEFVERDSYGAPRYDSAKTLARFVFSRDPKTGRLAETRTYP
jgi:hypothetical protein